MYAWQIQHFRVSLFTIGSDPITVSDDLFASLVGDQPDVDEKKARGAIRRRTYASPAARFELIEQPGRVDFTKIGPENLEIAALNGDMDRASLGGLDSVGNLAKESSKLLEVISDLTRVALAGLLYIPCDDAIASYEFLQKLLPKLDLNPETTSDIIFQINKFIQSNVIQDLRINRLSTYSSMGVKMQIPGQPGTHTGGHWTQLVLDVNTDGRNGSSISSGNYPALIDELVKNFIDLSNGVL